MDPNHPDVLPTDDADRRDWIRHHLPRLGLRREAEVRAQLRDYKFDDRQVDVLLSFFAMHEIWSDIHPRSRWGDPERYRRFRGDVLEIGVEVKPGGRAILRAPVWDPETSSRKHPAENRVEAVWDSHREGGRPVMTLTEMRVIGRLNWPFPDLAVYCAAFFVRMSREAPSEEERSRWRAFADGAQPRPRAGTAPDPTFYRDLLARYDRLIADRSFRPMQELAEALHENPNTVKSWIRRGRRYIKKGELG